MKYGTILEKHLNPCPKSPLLSETMLLSNNEEEVLNSLGLTTSQARVYMTLVRRGESNVAAISHASGICREHLYEVLKSLEKKGLVEKELGITTAYTAALLDVALSMLVKSRQQEVSELETKSKAIVENYEREKAVTPGSTKFKPELSITSNRHRTLNKVESCFDSATSQIDLVHTWSRFVQFWNYYEEILQRAMERGVKVRELTEFPPDVSQAQMFLGKKAFANKMFELRFVDKIGGNFALLDNKKMFMSATRSKPNLAQTPLLFSNYEGFLGIMQGYFKVSWENAHCWNPNMSATETMRQKGAGNSATEK